jgi:hypothetical protein
VRGLNGVDRVASGHPNGTRIHPRTVVDVGVGRGTPQLYEPFPKSFQVLIGPLKEHEPGLQDILTKYEGE